MDVRTHHDAPPLRTTNDVVNADANKAGLDSSSMDRAHRMGDTIDQLGSVTLLGFAVAGSAVMLGAHWLVG